MRLTVDEDCVQLNLSPSGDRLLTVEANSRLRLWSVATRSLIAQSDFSPARIEDAKFSNNGKYVAIATGQGCAQVFEGHRLSPLSGSMQHPHPVVSVHFSADDQKLATTSSDSFVRIWDWGAPDSSNQITHAFQPKASVVMAGGRHLYRQAGRFQRFSSFFEPHLQWFATFEDDHICRIWDVTSGLPLCPDLSGVTLNPSISPDGRWLLTVSDKLIQIHAIRCAGETAPPWLADFLEDATGCRFSPENGCQIQAPLAKSALRAKYPLAELANKSLLPVALR
ncbi:MAG TPA: WD40 repeat domain-containing protein [Candidatus Saccharimonadales bacterium]|nr:WD40 repeat domain-containing protein [Candidatus Saccharimonadales bacterium]